MRIAYDNVVSLKAFCVIACCLVYGATAQMDADTFTPNGTPQMETYAGHIYAYYTMGMRDGLPWQEAQRYCNYQGSNLTTITSEGEQNAIATFYKNEVQDPSMSQSAAEPAWIGGMRNGAGAYVWSPAGDAFTYENWHQQDPQSGSHVAIRKDTGQWGSYDESNSFPFICEYESICHFNPCSNGGTCSVGNNGQTRSCRCDSGYTGSSCELMTSSMCPEDYCSNDGTCTVVGTDFMCSCTDSYTGSRCSNDFNECAGGRNWCNNGTCRNSVGTFQCICNVGYEGDRCDQLLQDSEANTGGDEEEDTLFLGLAVVEGSAVISAAVIVLIIVIVTIVYKCRSAKKPIVTIHQEDLKSVVNRPPSGISLSSGISGVTLGTGGVDQSVASVANNAAPAAKAPPPPSQTPQGKQ